MTCCAPGAEAGINLNNPLAAEHDDATLLSVARDLGDGRHQLELAVPDIHCATCISTIERVLAKLDMVETARVNLSTRRVRIVFDVNKGAPSLLTKAIIDSGHRTFLLDEMDSNDHDETLSRLTRSMAVAGFAAGNIMLFSVSIWAGADAATRDLFHWISAFIAIPAVIYAGQPFFRSAFAALSVRRLNMDVPIALAVSLALLVSIYETAQGGEHAYFDASVSLLFFLLIGRTLDHLMREKARGAVKNLARLAPRRATLVLASGKREAVSIGEIEPGMRLSIAAGERLPVDCVVLSGSGETDFSLVNGEAVPELVEPGAELLAGTLILNGGLVVRATQPAGKSFLARMIELMEAAEGARAGYRRIADRAAAIYAPAVHLLALASFIGWMIATADWHASTLNAIAVLIITCPCALALAVPMVHIVAAGRLFESGIMMKDGTALERMARVTHVVFDKTGTLTHGQPQMTCQILGKPEALEKAAEIARRSTHPFSTAIAMAASGAQVFAGDTKEVPGSGLEASDDTGVWRLGNAQYCGAEQHLTDRDNSTVWLSHNAQLVAGFELKDSVRPDAQQTIKKLQAAGKTIILLSGDRTGPVKALAKTLDIPQAHAEVSPAEKIAFVQKLQNDGHDVLMVGDGINDAPAMRAANVSMAPSTAADVGRSAADFVFTRDNLMSVAHTLRLAQKAARAVKQNFGLAIAYNFLAVPLAISGQVTPLIAALAMSASSIVVTLNALRLRFVARDDKVVRAPRTESTLAATHPEPAE